MDLPKTEDQNKFEQQRQKRLSQIREMGIDPYGGRYDQTESAEDLKDRFKEVDDTQKACCAGRIVLLELPSIGDKKNAKFLGKWHKTIHADEVLNSSKLAKTGQLWLLAQSPIVHIVCKDNKCADQILKTGILSGFKNSGIKSFEGKTVVEILSTERLDSPVGKDGKLFCDDDYLRLLVDISNDVITRSTNKLYRFEDKIKEMFK